jgi:hypothetical protein
MRFAYALAALMIACSSSSLPLGPDDPARPEGLVVHEWGTFTSVAGSDGALLAGLHHEEEKLPAFVYGRNVMAGPGNGCPEMKCVEVTPAGVTQKLETPVLYFYGREAQALGVRVDFPTGVLSEWFPQVATFGPPLSQVEGQTPRAGFMRWEVELAPAVSEDRFPAVDPLDVWAPSRRVAATPLRIGDEHERFIFYRGLGAFTLPLAVEAEADGQVRVENHSDDGTPALFVLRVHEVGGRLGGKIQPLGRLAGRGSLRFPPPVEGKEHDLDVYVADAQRQIAAALVETGLYPDEAQAMVETWSRSYFQTPGLRLLYVVPRGWTDALLPLEVTPAPARLVRTLVGRVEVLDRAEEAALAARLAAAAQAARPPGPVIEELGRFAEPKIRRVKALAGDEAVRRYCDQLLATM